MPFYGAFACSVCGLWTTDRNHTTSVMPCAWTKNLFGSDAFKVSV